MDNGHPVFDLPLINAMSECQPAILQAVPPLARFASYTLHPGSKPAASLRALARLADGDRTVAGLGLSLVSALGYHIEGLRPFPEFSGFGIDMPSTPAALWLWLRGKDAGELFHRQREINAAIGEAFRANQVIDAFKHGSGRDITGYEDGTENPKGKKAVQAAVCTDRGLAGSSFVAVQQWEHDLERFNAMSPAGRDHCIGRRLSDNAELDDAPDSAHVKRTAQESFDPEAFVVRRSMPWTEGQRCGLVFTAFGRSLDPFEAQLRRMLGVEDGTSDALFQFTRPLSGAYFWCPPVKGGRLDLSAIEL